MVQTERTDQKVVIVHVHIEWIEDLILVFVLDSYARDDAERGR